jgi:hypothetical protein
MIAAVERGQTWVDQYAMQTSATKYTMCSIITLRYDRLQSSSLLSSLGGVDSPWPPEASAPRSWASSALHFVILPSYDMTPRTETLKESCALSALLGTLGNVVTAAAESKDSRLFVPYRNSHITNLLSDCLGGASYGVLIGHLASDLADDDPFTSSVLHLAKRWRTIRSYHSCMSRLPPPVPWGTRLPDKDPVCAVLQ